MTVVYCWSTSAATMKHIDCPLPPQCREKQMARSFDEVREVIEKNKPKLAASYGIRSIGVFGSFARGEQGSRSDVDILVEFDEVPGLLQFIRIEEHLRRLLGRKVDL